MDSHSTLEALPAGHEKNEVFRDITEEFFRESQRLAIGELVQHPRFTLLEAVGALEIMDPKMDSGLIEEIEFNANEPRLPTEIIGIMDQMLSHEAAWHTGAALSQTVYTCLYLDKLLSLAPQSLDEAVFDALWKRKTDFTPEEGLIHLVLRAYCLSVGKCCGIVIERIREENCRGVPRLHDSYFIIEEEDIVCQTYNVPLFDSISSEDILQALDDASKWLEANKTAWDADTYTALLSRVAYRRHFLHAISLSPDEYIEEGTPRDSLEGCITHLSLIQSTNATGKQCTGAFNTAVQRKLASTVPPRPMINLEFSDAIERISRILKDSKEVLNLMEATSALNIMTFLSRISARNPQPSAFVRSMCRAVLFMKGQIVGKFSPLDLIMDDVKETVFPDAMLFDPRNQAIENPQHDGFMIRERVEWFVMRAVPLYLQLCTDFLQNRSRMRRNLCHAIQEWDSFQLDAERVDEELSGIIGEEGLQIGDTLAYSFSLSSWAYLIKLRLMEYICLLGFELEVYQPYEFGGLYWITAVYCQTRMGHLERIREFALAQIQPEDEIMDLKTWENSRIKFMGYLNYSLLEDSAMHDLCSGLAMLYGVLVHLGLIKLPPSPYSTDELRYELRMKPFQNIVCPDVLPFEGVPREYFSPTEYIKAVGKNKNQKALETLQEATQLLKLARANYEMLIKLDPHISRSLLCVDDHKADLKSCLKSCVGASVAIIMLQNAIKANNLDTLTASVDREKYHCYFPVPVLKPAAAKGKN